MPDHKTLRQLFEDRCWEHYLAERQRRDLPGDVPDEQPTREQLFWLQPDGRYGVLAFNTAWQGWCWAIECFGEPVAQIVAIGQYEFPGLQWLSADHSFREPIGSLLCAIKE